MERIDDYNQITQHFMNVIHCFVDNDLHDNWGRNEVQHAIVQPSVYRDIELSSKVYQFIALEKFSTNVHGCHIDDILELFPNSSVQDLLSIIDHLVEVGRIYETWKGARTVSFASAKRIFDCHRFFKASVFG